jgi:hypothetical protein
VPPWFDRALTPFPAAARAADVAGDWLRLDHAYAIEMAPHQTTAQNLHGGNRMAMGEHQYHWYQGRMYNGLLVVMYALEDVNPGDGGFICVPGSVRPRIGGATIGHPGSRPR